MSLFLQSLSPFPPALSSFPGHELAETSAWSGRFSQHCAFSLYRSLLAYTIRKCQLLPERLRISLCPKDSASAASTTTTAEQPQVGHGREETLQQCTLTMGRLPYNLRSSSENAMGWQPRSLQRWTLNHSPPPLFRKIWPPHKNMRLTLAKIINYNLVPELYVVMQHRSDL